MLRIEAFGSRVLGFYLYYHDMNKMLVDENLVNLHSEAKTTSKLSSHVYIRTTKLDSLSLE